MSKYALIFFAWPVWGKTGLKEFDINGVVCSENISELEDLHRCYLTHNLTFRYPHMPHLTFTKQQDFSGTTLICRLIDPSIKCLTCMQHITL